jgi:hypothetical protein
LLVYSNEGFEPEGRRFDSCRAHRRARGRRKNTRAIAASEARHADEGRRREEAEAKAKEAMPRLKEKAEEQRQAAQVRITESLERQRAR